MVQNQTNWCDLFLSKSGQSDVWSGSLKQLAKVNFPEMFVQAGKHLQTTICPSWLQVIPKNELWVWKSYISWKAKYPSTICLWHRYFKFSFNPNWTLIIDVLKNNINIVKNVPYYIYIYIYTYKYDAGQQIHKCSYAIKFKILVQKNAPVWVLSHVYIYIYIYHTISHEQGEQYHKSADFVPIYHELKCDFIQQFSKKKLILCYILNTILCFCSIFQRT